PGPPCCCACWARSSGDGPNASSNARFHSFSSMPSRSLSHSACCPPRPSVSSERPVSFQVCSISSPARSNDSRLQSGSKASGVNTSPQPCWAISSSEACGLPPIRALTPTFSDPATYWSCSHSVPAARPRRLASWLASFTRARTPHSQRSQKSSKSVDRPWCPASIPVIDSPEKPLPMIEPVAPPNSPSPSMVAPTPLVNFATDAASRFRSTSSAATPVPLPVRAGVAGVHGGFFGHDPRDRREVHRPVLGRDVHRQTGRLPQPRHDLVHDPGPQQRRIVQRPFRHPALLREPGQRRLVREGTHPPHPARVRAPQPPVHRRHQQHRPPHLPHQRTRITKPRPLLGYSLGQRRPGLLHDPSLVTVPKVTGGTVEQTRVKGAVVLVKP